MAELRKGIQEKKQQNKKNESKMQHKSELILQKDRIYRKYLQILQQIHRGSK